MKIACGVEYDGSHYRGWQRQLNVESVQQKIEQALSQVADEAITITCAGRTDAGVHATSQVIHFETDKQRSTYSWQAGANHYLPKDIHLTWAQPVAEDFHARYSATARRYHYILYNNTTRPSIGRQYVSWHYPPLDAEKMAQAGQCLIGEHDFSSFRDADCQSHSPNRNLHHLNIQRRGDLILIDIKANAFLHHMVRNITGCLLQIGEGKQPIPWMEQVLAAQDRQAASITAKGEGLYLVEVEYPKIFQLPAIYRAPLFLGNNE